MSGLSILLTALIVVLTGVYFYLKRRYKYWEDQGIEGPKPTMILGNVKDSLLLRFTEAEVLNKISSDYENQKYVGIYNLWKPVLLVKDLELAKTLLEKHFDHFTDRPKFLGNEKTDYAMYSLFSMEGDVWRSRRHCFNKLFTPKKMKEYCDDMETSLNYFLNEMDEHAKNGKDIDIMTALEEYTVHVIMSAMYGLDLTKDKTRTKALAENIRFFVHPPAWNVIKFVFFSVQPTLFKLLKMKTLPSKVFNFTSKLLDEMAITRETSGQDRNDALTVVKKLQSEGTPEIRKIDYKEAVGHVFSLSESGSHTTSTSLSHVLARLADHPDVQEKARAEVDSVLKGSKVVTYEDVMKMPYLESVISETMRISPLVAILKRICTKDFKVDDKLTIPKGMDVIFDIRYLQNHPDYFKEPDTFNPDRFKEGEFEHTAFMPFGKGPRICIGMKFADVEMKVTLAKLLSRYIILPSDKLERPMTFDPRTVFFSNVPIGSIWIKLKLREVCA